MSSIDHQKQNVGAYGEVLLFFATLLVALTAGRAFWVWLGESPFDLSGQTYVEFFQQLDQKIAIPIAITGIGGVLLSGAAAVVYRRQRSVFYFLLSAFILALVASSVTLLFNIPVNKELATWDPAALPTGYEDFLRRWWVWHHVRFAAIFLAMCALFTSMLVKK